jgi:hypothetical protein
MPPKAGLRTRVKVDWGEKLVPTPRPELTGDAYFPQEGYTFICMEKEPQKYTDLAEIGEFGPGIDDGLAYPWQKGPGGLAYWDTNISYGAASNWPHVFGYDVSAVNEENSAWSLRRAWQFAMDGTAAGDGDEIPESVVHFRPEDEPDPSNDPVASAWYVSGTHNGYDAATLDFPAAGVLRVRRDTTFLETLGLTLGHTDPLGPGMSPPYVYPATVGSVVTFSGVFEPFGGEGDEFQAILFFEGSQGTVTYGDLFGTGPFSITSTAPAGTTHVLFRVNHSTQVAPEVGDGYYILNPSITISALMGERLNFAFTFWDKYQLIGYPEFWYEWPATAPLTSNALALFDPFAVPGYAGAFWLEGNDINGCVLTADVLPEPGTSPYAGYLWAYGSELTPDDVSVAAHKGPTQFFKTTSYISRRYGFQGLQACNVGEDRVLLVYRADENVEAVLVERNGVELIFGEPVTIYEAGGLAVDPPALGLYLAEKTPSVADGFQDSYRLALAVTCGTIVPSGPDDDGPPYGISEFRYFALDVTDSITVGGTHVVDNVLTAPALNYWGSVACAGDDVVVLYVWNDEAADLDFARMVTRVLDADMQPRGAPQQNTVGVWGVSAVGFSDGRVLISGGIEFADGGVAHRSSWYDHLYRIENGLLVLQDGVPTYSYRPVISLRRFDEDLVVSHDWHTAISIMFCGGKPKGYWAPQLTRVDDEWVLNEHYEFLGWHSGDYEDYYNRYDVYRAVHNWRAVHVNEAGEIDKVGRPLTVYNARYIAGSARIRDRVFVTTYGGEFEVADAVAIAEGVEPGRLYTQAFRIEDDGAITPGERVEVGQWTEGEVVIPVETNRPSMAPIADGRALLLYDMGPQASSSGRELFARVVSVSENLGVALGEPVSVVADVTAQDSDAFPPWGLYMLDESQAVVIFTYETATHYVPDPDLYPPGRIWAGVGLAALTVTGTSVQVGEVLHPNGPMDMVQYDSNWHGEASRLGQSGNAYINSVVCGNTLVFPHVIVPNVGWPYPSWPGNEDLTFILLFALINVVAGNFDIRVVPATHSLEELPPSPQGAALPDGYARYDHAMYCPVNDTDFLHMDCYTLEAPIDDESGQIAIQRWHIGEESVEYVPGSRLVFGYEKGSSWPYQFTKVNASTAMAVQALNGLFDTDGYGWSEDPTAVARTIRFGGGGRRGVVNTGEKSQGLRARSDGTDGR